MSDDESTDSVSDKTSDPNGLALSHKNVPSFSATAPVPVCTMKILVADTQKEIVAENVKIGDRLQLVVYITEQGW